TAQRYASGTDYIQLTRGLDGNLYALQPWNGLGSLVDEFDPNTMTLIGSVNLAAGTDQRAIAVDANGDIYATDYNHSVFHYNSAGALLGSLTGYGGTDINLALDGELVLGPVSNSVTRMQKDFSNIRSVSLPSGTSGYFVAFADPQM